MAGHLHVNRECKTIPTEVGVSSLVASDLDVLLEEKPPKALVLSGYSVAAFCTILLVTAGVLETDVVVIGAGEVAINSPTIVLQPYERASLRDIKVKPGQRVTAGQVLAELDATFVEADLSSIRTQLATTQSQVQRLEAEINGRPYEISASASQMEKLQFAIAQRRFEEFSSRLEAIDAEIKKLQALGETLAVDHSLIRQQLTIAREVEGMRDQLLQKQAGSRLHQLESQNARLKAEREQSDVDSRRNDIVLALRIRQSERQEFIDKWKREALEELNQKTTELAKLKESYAKLERLNQLVVLSSPVDAYVLEIADRARGSVIREAEPIVTLVPSQGELIADVWISSKDIGFVRTDDEVRVKVDAFPYQRYGALLGKLGSIAKMSYASTHTDIGQPRNNDPQKAMHRANIVLRGVKTDSGRELEIMPGMTVSAEIKVGTRSVLSYFMEPLTKALHESIREP